MKLTKQYNEIVGVTHIEGEEQCHDVLPRIIQLEAENEKLKGFWNALIEIFKDPVQEPKLTAKQREAARLASQGLTSKEIAEAMNTTKTAVDSMLEKVRYKTGMGKNELVKNLIKQIEKAIK